MEFYWPFFLLRRKLFTRMLDYKTQVVYMCSNLFQFVPGSRDLYQADQIHKWSWMMKVVISSENS